MKLVYTGKTKNVYALDNGHYLLKTLIAYTLDLAQLNLKCRKINCFVLFSE